MPRTLQQPGIIFSVDDVLPGREPLPECRLHEAVRMKVGDIESCSDYHGTVVKDILDQPLLAAVFLAFSQHRPLVLTPDAVWITIAQGVAHHMAIHSERLRSRFVAHQGKAKLVFECQGWVERSPENPWPEAFASWSGQIRDHVGSQVHNLLVSDFSTTGPVERSVSEIVMMDVFEKYFEYECCCICGIPTVTLEGTTDDWQRLADKAAGLAIFDLDWWLPHLLPICEQFVQTSRGNIDLAHWQNICKLQDAYGGSIINGWVAKLFPYLTGATGSYNLRNPVFETGEGFGAGSAPSGLSRVPFKWRNLQTGEPRYMEAIGGLVGVTQEPGSLALRPKVGWAVRTADHFGKLLSRLSEDHATFPGAKLTQPSGVPLDMAQFYVRTDGAELFDVNHESTCRFLSLEAVDDLARNSKTVNASGETTDEMTWFRFASLRDGSWLAINPDAKDYGGVWRNDSRLQDQLTALGQRFAPICQVPATSDGSHMRLNKVVALSFTELLERMLDGGGQPYWLDPQFAGYGDAEQFEHRDGEFHCGA